MGIKELNERVIEEFRANKGKVGGRFESYPLLLLKTIGANSGEERTKPLAYFADGERLIVVASYAGAPASPPWFFNLKKTAEVGVEVGEEQYRAIASVIDEPERTNLYKRIAAVMPIFTEYQEKTDRIIPLVALSRID